MRRLGLYTFVLSLCSMSFATSIRSTALESHQIPLRGFGKQAIVIRLAADGEAFGGACRLDGRNPLRLRDSEINWASCEWQTIKFMTNQEMRRISRLTALARLGQIQYPDPRGLHCMAIPTQKIQMHANNGTVLLKAGTSPCGHLTYNKSRAAQELVEELQNLSATFQRMID